MKFIKTTDTHYGHNEKTHKVHTKFLDRMARAAHDANVDALLHTGDWISCNQHQMPRTWRMFREAFGDLPILTVRGNHCLWNYDTFHSNMAKKRKYDKMGIRTLQDIYQYHKEWAEEHKIHLLQDNPYETEDTVIYGFDGWYAQHSGSNDHKFMPRTYESAPIGVWLNNEAHNHFDTVLELARFEAKKKVLLTHMCPHDRRLGENMRADMNANPRWLPFMSSTFDVVCFGHTHWSVDTEVDGCRFINAGTDYDNYSHGYNKPKYFIFEV